MKEKYLSTRKHSETLCQPLHTEDYVVQPAEDISPPKWHLAHTTWFWEEFVLSKNVTSYQRYHPSYSFLFNSYYNSIGDRVLRIDRGNMSRPTVEEIYAYRKFVDEHMALHFNQFEQQILSLIEIGIQHEQQHQELLLTDIKYILGNNPLFPPYDKNFKETTQFDTNKTFHTIQEGKYSIGYNGKGFCFDNEMKHHEVFLPSFSIRKSLVTNAEYLSFVQDKGYERQAFWHSDGWTWIQQNKIFAPLYWHFIDGQWHRYALSGLEPVNLQEPVTHISFYEAAAFAEWAGYRLPTEFEWETSYDFITHGQRWEHTQSAYLPYPGYQKPPGAIGEYNGKFMVNQMVLRGSSVATPEGHTRSTYRNFFHPHLRWQFNGIRLCEK